MLLDQERLASIPGDNQQDGHDIVNIYLGIYIALITVLSECLIDINLHHRSSR